MVRTVFHTSTALDSTASALTLFMIVRLDGIVVSSPRNLFSLDRVDLLALAQG